MSARRTLIATLLAAALAAGAAHAAPETADAPLAMATPPAGALVAPPPTDPGPPALAPAAPLPIVGFPARILEALETTAPHAAWNAGQPTAATVRDYYARRAFEPIWTDPTGPLFRARTLVDAILAVRDDGLEPSDYLTPAVNMLFEAADVEGLARLEAALTWAYVRLVSDLASGRTVPNEVDPELFVHPHEVDLVAALDRALDVTDVRPVVANHAPQTDGYRKLKAALAQYRKIRDLGGWTAMSDGEIMRPGDRGARVLELKRVLAERGEAVLPDGEDFDDALETALREFQERHGLKPDGHFGPNTLRALNRPVEGRIEQIKLNMERQRWMPANLGARYAFVNLANYRLKIVFHDEIVYETRVVVGTAADRTPVFSDRMTYLVINPYWNIPPSIAGEEMLPQLREDPYSLQAKGIRLFSGWAAGAEEIDPGMIDWANVSARRFPFKLRQDPGDQNALGRVKFMFPNQFNIYLHDTPSKSLFNRTVRAFSHGCIRVEEPFRLAKLLLSEDPRWTSERFDNEIAGLQRRVVTLPHPIDVHLTYLTAWVDDAGLVQFRTDVYRRDDKLTAALDASREDRVAEGPAKPATASAAN